MKSYPKPGDKVIIKDGGEIAIVLCLWKPGRVMLTDGRIFHLGGLKLCKQ
jgi:hypothetical protein